MPIFANTVISDDAVLAERHCLPENQSDRKIKFLEIRIKAQRLKDLLTAMKAQA